jgi:hypothetical protein
MADDAGILDPEGRRVVEVLVMVAEAGIEFTKAGGRGDLPWSHRAITAMKLPGEQKQAGGGVAASVRLLLVKHHMIDGKQWNLRDYPDLLSVRRAVSLPAVVRG